MNKETITKSTPVKKILQLGKDCKRCSLCCKYGTGFLVKEDIKRIAEYLKLREKELISDYLEHGSVRNSVNFPEVSLHRAGASRVTVVNENRPDMLAQISHQLGQAGMNISHMVNESRGDIAYTVVDLDENVENGCCSQLREIDGVLKVRIL